VKELDSDKVQVQEAKAGREREQVLIGWLVVEKREAGGGVLLLCRVEERGEFG
jgi:hypothetical protein